MNFGICGYGNLGRSVEKTILNSGENLVGIFTRRKGIESKYKTPIYAFEDAPNFAKDIDVMFMCGGSQEDLLWQSPKMLEYFNIIDTFDTHAKAKLHRDNLQKQALKSGKVAIFSCGWDPGLFSLARILFACVFNEKPQTFWGKGVSQGHSEALRNICGVEDAVQFTIPNKTLLKKAKNNSSCDIEENLKHERHCYIVLNGTRSFEDVKRDILNTENYFKGQKVFVNQVGKEELERLKKQTSHRGVVLAGDLKAKAEFSVKMKNNTDFTSQIMFAYAKIAFKLKAGAYSVLDIPAAWLLEEENLLKFL